MENKQSLLYLIPKSSYYNSQKEVIDEGKNLHNDIFKEDRVLYAYLLYFTDATYYSKSLIVERLLGNSIYKDEYKSLLENDAALPNVEEKLIFNVLFNENITHALKLLMKLKDERVNNARTQKLILRFLFDRGNTDWIVIKYKNKVKSLLVHALGLKNCHNILNETKDGMDKYNKLIKIWKNPYDLEIFHFVFDKDMDFTSNYLKEYIEIKNDFKNNTIDLRKPVNLPIEVLEGFNNFYKRGLNIASLVSVSNVSEKQKIQIQNTVKKQSNNTVEVKIDLTKYSIMDLLKYMYNKMDITTDEINECNKIIDEKAKAIRDSIKDEFIVDINTAVIVDCSDSHYGSKQTKMHPFFKNIMLAHIFNNGDNVFYVGGKNDEKGLLQPCGDSDLTTPLLDVVSKNFKNVIVLSDGFENVGSFNKVYRQLKAIGVDINAVHFNPVFSPKNFSFKSISDDIVAFPFNSEKDIQNMMLFYLLNTNPKEFKKKVRAKIDATLS